MLVEHFKTYIVYARSSSWSTISEMLVVAYGYMGLGKILYSGFVSYLAE